MKIFRVCLYEMPSFTPILNSKGEWYNIEDFRVVSERLGTLIIPKGAISNLASIPILARIFIPVNSTHRLASVVHDHLYNTKGVVSYVNNKGDYSFVTLSREDVDLLFLDMLRMETIKTVNPDTKKYHDPKNLNKPLVNKYIAYIMYYAVRFGGWYNWRKKIEQRFDCL